MQAFFSLFLPILTLDEDIQLKTPSQANKLNNNYYVLVCVCISKLCFSSFYIIIIIIMV